MKRNDTVPGSNPKKMALIGICFMCLSTLYGFSQKKDAGSKESSLKIDLPEPYATESARKNSKVVGWPDDKKPVAPDGFVVTRYADKLNNPRWIYIADNGDIFIAESNTNKGKSANDIILLRDKDKDGFAETHEVFLKDLNQPFGMLILKGWFYVANTDGVYRYPYTAGTAITEPGQKIVDLPAGGYNNHWTRNLLANSDGSKIYISVGSGSNVAEHGMDNEIRRANILEVNPDGTGERIYASGIRNPIGLAWQPGTNILWTAVNERDNLGDELVPDYLTSVKDGGFYGWPYAYYGKHEDPRLKGKNPELVEKTITPDVSMGAHTASLGLAFYTKKIFPPKYQNGAFVGQHGSWNRSSFSGYKVVFVPFINGSYGSKEDFLTGFVANEEKNEVYGRPVCVRETQDGALLVSDDSGGIIWKVAAKKQRAVNP